MSRTQCSYTGPIQADEHCPRARICFANKMRAGLHIVWVGALVPLASSSVECAKQLVLVQNLVGFWRRHSSFYLDSSIANRNWSVSFRLMLCRQQTGAEKVNSVRGTRS